jgi:ubiquinone/menaquinone biosynthesis C-methylase UbiE
VEIRAAVSLIRDAVGRDTGTWADLGAGTGTFTHALAEILGPGSVIYAVDKDARALRALDSWRATSASQVVPVRADFTVTVDLPELRDALLDGILLANALHFVRDARRVLAQLTQRVRIGGKIVVVEYDRRAASRWVPYPIPKSEWPELAKAAGLSNATVTATRPSTYAGLLYAATASKQ